MRKKQLLLVYPYQKGKTIGYGETSALGLPPLGLGYIAALTPQHWDVTILDETTESINFSKTYDLVGISALTANVNRAYEISQAFRSQKIPVVMGGIHCSLLPNEALEYVDCVVIGEAENIWAQVIKDFESGSLQKKYEGDRPSLKNMPIPRRELFSKNYEIEVIQTTRGCPFDCEFCVVTKFNGSKFRTRPAEEVLDELETIKSKIVYFLDDNFFGGYNGKNRALDVFKGMIQRKIKKYWATQTSINISDDEEVLRYAFKSGCRGVYIGIESVDIENLKQIKKTTNLKLGNEGIIKAIKRFHKHGIAVLGAFVFGCDNDDPSIFPKTIDFINKSGLDSFDLSMMMPYPGTKLYDRLEKEERLLLSNFPEQWSLFDEQNVLLKPKNISIIDLVRGYDHIVKTKLSKRSIIRQAFKSFYNTRNLISTFLALQTNLSNRKIYDGYRKFKNIS